MTDLDDVAFVEDFRRSRRSLERAGCEPCLVYAFPNGSHRSGQAELLRREGVRHVLLVGDTASQPDAWLHPRLTLRGHSTAELRVRTTTAGALHRRGARRAG
jgi:hypothetical protein